jgi:hypothetical protein
MVAQVQKERPTFGKASLVFSGNQYFERNRCKDIQKNIADKPSADQGISNSG